jgi:hypothetical protein
MHPLLQGNYMYNLIQLPKSLLSTDKVTCSIAIRFVDGRSSIVSLATGYRLDGRWVVVLAFCRVKNFQLSVTPRIYLGTTQPPVYWVWRNLLSILK